MSASHCTRACALRDSTVQNPLQRIRNIAENPAAAVVVDRYDDDCAKLGWVMLGGRPRSCPTAQSTTALRRCCERGIANWRQ